MRKLRLMRKHKNLTIKRSRKKKREIYFFDRDTRRRSDPIRSKEFATQMVEIYYMQEDISFFTYRYLLQRISALDIPDSEDERSSFQIPRSEEEVPIRPNIA